MSTDNKKHYLYVNGQKVPVSEQVYRALSHPIPVR